MQPNLTGFNLNDVQNVLWVVIKWMLVFGVGIYSLFALMVVKQVRIMAQTLEDPANPIVTIFSWLHLGLALFLLVAIVLLL